MHRVYIAIAVILLTCAPAFADAPKVPSGLYVLLDGEAAKTGQQLNRADASGTLAIGKKLSDRFIKPTLISETNDNSRFRLRVSFPVANNADLNSHQLVVVVADKAMPVWGHSVPGGGGNFVDVDSNVAGQELAEKIAGELEIPAQLRKHPGHQWIVALEPEKQSYQVDEPVVLKLTIKNVGKTTIGFMDGGMNRGRRNNQFEFIAFAGSGYGDPIPDSGDPRNFGGLAGYVSLKPGDVFTKTAKLSDWFNFEQPDTYRITGIFRVALHDPVDEHRNLWDDFAIGECTVKIEDDATK